MTGNENGLSIERLISVGTNAISSAMRPDIVYVDVRIEAKRRQGFKCENGCFSNTFFEHESGTCSRALTRGKRIGFACISGTSIDGVQKAIRRSTTTGRLSNFPKGGLAWESRPPRVYMIRAQRDNVRFENISDFVTRFGNELLLRGIHSSVTYEDTSRSRLFLDSEGSAVTENSHHLGLGLEYWKMVSGRCVLGEKTFGGHEIRGLVECPDMAGLAVDFSEELLGKSEPLPSRLPPTELPTVFCRDALATLVHELFCHPLEASIHPQSTMQMGSSFASDEVTVVDDPTSLDTLATYKFDDEGIAASRTTLIENGQVRGCLFDRMSAAVHGTESTGNGRAQDYTQVPSCRGSNTFIAPGDWSFEEMTTEYHTCLVVDQVAGSFGDPGVGQSTATLELLSGYLMSSGSRTHNVRGNVLIARAGDLLRSIAAVGKDNTAIVPMICVKLGSRIDIAQGGAPILIEKVKVT